MDDSDQDFVDLCSKLLKRVRKKEYDNIIPRNAKPQSSTQTSTGDKSKRRGKKNDFSSKRAAVVNATQPASVANGLDPTEPCNKLVEHKERVVQGGGLHQSQGTGPPVSEDSGASSDIVERAARPKDEVLFRMQQFKRVSPHKLMHNGKSKPTGTASSVLLLPQGQDCPQPSRSGLHLDSQTSDEDLALRLQQELDREVAEVQAVELEDQGLFFCQLCHRDLSHMTPEGRTQHINRCLDESEDSATAPRPPPAVPDCPICGKRFKAQKSRSAHLKRCSSAMDVSPAMLLHCLHRQAAEAQRDSTVTQPVQYGGSKRKGPSNPALPLRKKPRKKAQPLDEDTMVALALSSSLLQQEKQQAAEMLLQEASAFHISTAPQLKPRPGIGKGPGKKKKGAAPRPPPLLLVQDTEAALLRLQDRVSALLLQSHSASPPTPTRCPSRLPAWSGAAPLWQKSALWDGGARNQSEFYTPELRGFLLPLEKECGLSSTTTNMPESSLHPPAREDISLTSSQTDPISAPSTSGTGLHIASQAIRDLMKLSEEGLTLSQFGYTTPGPAKDNHLSGFVPEEPEEQVELCLSGFMPDTTYTCQSEADAERSNPKTMALSRLATDLSSMVNNPQLSDVQLQVDNGEVYFAHSFMLYARCPLLAQMVHESGFGVQEEGMPAAERVLLGDVPGEAVYTLLQYLYTARCPVTASLRPHVLELASRFDLEGLQQLCQLHQEATEAQGEDAAEGQGQASGTREVHGDHSFIELLRSVWNEGDDEAGEPDEGRDGEGGLEKGGSLSEDGGMHEEQVNEEEMEEIYEFAATQRQRDDKEAEEKRDETEEPQMGGDQIFTEANSPKPNLISTDSIGKAPQLDTSLGRSYSRLFSDSWGLYEEDPATPPKTPPSSREQSSPHKPSPKTVIDLSVSPPPPPPITSSMPLLGLSPQVIADSGDGGVIAEKISQGSSHSRKGLSPKQESQSRSICAPSSPVSPQNVKEPELIVLSDSSEDIEVDLAAVCSPSPSPPSPYPRQSLQNNTQMKNRPNLEPNMLVLENRDSSLVLDSTTAARCSDDPNPLDCSPEVSWLIPGTPVQASSSTSSISTQTHSSMRRTQLFPKASSQSSSSFVSLHSSARGSHQFTQLEDVSRMEVDRSSPDSTSLNGENKGREMVFAAPPSQHKHSPTHIRLSCTHQGNASMKSTPLQRHPHPYSSTPLNMDLPRSPVSVETSPLHYDGSREGSTGQGSGLFDSMGKRGLRLSLSSSSSSSVCRGPNGDSRLSSESRPFLETGTPAEKTGDEEEEAEMGVDREEKEMETEGAQKEVTPPEVFDPSFRHSFMDEPPMAFNDSWGLEAAADADYGGGGVCFSLRLEDSGGAEDPAKSSSLNVSYSPRRVPSSALAKQHITRSPSTLSAKPTTQTGAPLTPSPPDPTTSCAPEINASLLDPNMWDSWADEEGVLPLSQRLNPLTQLKTPVSSRSRKSTPLVPITPMPSYSDMDTPELKNKLNRFGVRALPKRQMILKLKEIHQYTHQLVGSDSDDDSLGRPAQAKPLPTTTGPSTRPVSCAQQVMFQQPKAPTGITPLTHNKDVAEPLSASQGSNTSTASSEESERSNPELCVSTNSDSDSDGGVPASQVVSRLQDRLKAVHAFILSDLELCNQILQYQPLVLSQLQARLKDAGIRLGAAKLLDYLDAQCITFTTAKPGQAAPSRRRGKGRGMVKATEKRVRGRKKGTAGD